MVENNGKDGHGLSPVVQSIIHQLSEAEGTDSSVNDTKPQGPDVTTKPRRVSPVVELANRLVVEADQLAKDEAKRAEDIEAATVRAQGTIQAAERNADQLRSEVRALADNVAEEMRSGVNRVNDLISAFTNSMDLPPATDRSAGRSQNNANNGKATHPSDGSPMSH